MVIHLQLGVWLQCSDRCHYLRSKIIYLVPTPTQSIRTHNAVVTMTMIAMVPRIPPTTAAWLSTILKKDWRSVWAPISSAKSRDVKLLASLPGSTGTLMWSTVTFIGVATYNRPLNSTLNSPLSTWNCSYFFSTDVADNIMWMWNYLSKS